MRNSTRIHADAIGEFVHQDFREEAPLRMSWRAHRPLLAGVDVDVLVSAAAIGELVDVGKREIRAGARAAGAPALAHRTRSACRLRRRRL